MYILYSSELLEYYILIGMHTSLTCATRGVGGGHSDVHGQIMPNLQNMRYFFQNWGWRYLKYFQFYFEPIQT